MVTLHPDDQALVQIILEDLHSLNLGHIPGADLTLRPLLREAQIISLMASCHVSRV
jgi:hypothetical protein